MQSCFEVGVTRDFLTANGALTYKDIGLGLLESESQCDHRFLDTHLNPVHANQIASLDAVLSLTPAWNAETFSQGAERLLIVARFGVGYDMCDVAALTANDVLLTITPGATDLPVAGGVLAMMLSMSRRLFQKDRLVREGRWGQRSSFMGTEIAGKTLGIVGFGGAGRKLCELVKPFGMTVIAFDPYAPHGAFDSYGVKRAANIAEVFSQSDYVSMHCLLNDETKGMINKSLFDTMKPTAYFFNAARGPIVNEADLIEALQCGRIAGAGLDCFEQEPPSPDNPLFQMENVLVTPHAVCWTDECFQAIGGSAVRSILSVKRGERPFGLVNPEVFESERFQRKLAAMRKRLATVGA